MKAEGPKVVWDPVLAELSAQKSTRETFLLRIRSIHGINDKKDYTSR